MLLGDRVEKVLKTIGADKLAEIYQKVGKRPCGCASRRDALNRWHQKVLDTIEEMKKDGKIK